MLTTKQCIGFVRSRSESLATSYQKIQGERLSDVLTSAGEQRIPLSGVIAAYDQASCSIMRIREILTDCSYEQPSEEQALRIILDGLTREILFLGSAKAQTRGRGLFIGEADPNLQRYHQSQAEVLGTVLLDIEGILAPVLTCYITSFIDEEQIQILDAEPYWSETTRRKFVAEICQKLNGEGKLDESYSLIACDLLKIEYPLDIHGEEDRYRRCALPTLVRRLRVADLIDFIAGLRVECARRDAWSMWSIAIGGCLSEAQTLLERRAATIPQPNLSLRMRVFQDALPLLNRVGLAVVHPEPCLRCQTHDGHCDVFQVTFPEGTAFGEATQTEFDQLQHSYTFTPTLPGHLPDGWCVFLDYSGIWESDCPWRLAVLDLGKEVTPEVEKK